jgi:3-oxoacyl-[acyl-carrier protein] reductase
MTRPKSEKRVAIVAGGTGGIGSAICERLRADGCEVVSASRWLTIPLPTESQGIHQLKCDITSENECKELVQRTLETFGRVDCMAYAAIGYHQGAPESHNAAKLHDIFSANVYGAFFLSTCCFSLAMKSAKNGSICFIGSSSERNILPGRAAYCASKAAMSGLCRALAVDWAYAKVRVNSVVAAYVGTALELSGAESGTWGHSLDDMVRRTPLGSLAAPEQIAAAVAWIMSPEAAHVTGAELAVDGGWAAWSGFGSL